MAERHAVNYAKTQTMPAGMAAAGTYDGNARAHYDVYTTTGSEAAADTIVMGVMRTTERAQKFRLKHGALGAGVTLAVGIEGKPNLFVGATAAATAAIIEGPDTDEGFAYELTGNYDKKIIVTIAGASPAATQKIQYQAIFTREGI